MLDKTLYLLYTIFFFFFFFWQCLVPRASRPMESCLLRLFMNSRGGQSELEILFSICLSPIPGELKRRHKIPTPNFEISAGKDGKTANKVADVDDIAKSFDNLNCLDISLSKFNAPFSGIFFVDRSRLNLKLVSNVLDLRVRFEFGRFV